MRPLRKTPRIAGVPLTKNTIISLGKGVKDSLLNNKVSEEEKERKLSICRSCEHFDAPRCTLCGCYMNFKAALASSECPAGKWSVPLRELSIDHSSKTEKPE